MYKARNYHHPKRPKMDFKDNAYDKFQNSPVVNKHSKKSYLKDIGDEITLKPFNLNRQKTSKNGGE